MGKGTVLYVGGFQLPDQNAAALRVLANAKALREIGYRVIFINALKDTLRDGVHPPVGHELRYALGDTYIDKKRKAVYESFECYEYQRESQIEYLFRCNRVLSVLKRTEADTVIAYNYPAIALNRLRKYCQRYGVKCYADTTEWYVPEGNLLFRMIKKMDTEWRMRYVQTHMDGVIVISEYLYQYYKDKLKTVKIPPMVDLEEDKWKEKACREHDGIRLAYAGSPSKQKERLELVINAVEQAGINEKISLDVIGITKEQYQSIYGCQYDGKRVTFHGRIPNSQVIKMTKEADWTIVIREKNKAVQAGFPTKVSESISCGTPVIANRFSNIEEYLDESNSILIPTLEELPSVFLTLKKGQGLRVDSYLFDFRRYLEQMRTFMG